jgi:hypothetical protein
MIDRTAARGAIDPMQCVEADQTDRLAEDHPVEIATARERAEWTLPPIRWMD